jgi:hypothetical protein
MMQRTEEQAAAASERRVPAADLRRALRCLIAQGKLAEATEVRRRFEIQALLPLPRSPIVRPGEPAVSGRGAGSSERPLTYPFTKGITFVNDGVAYGEVIVELWTRGDGGCATRRVLRTRTGRTDLPAALPSAVSDQFPRHDAENGYGERS